LQILSHHRYADLQGKMMGITGHADSMKSVLCPVDPDHIPGIISDRTGQFKYIPNGELALVAADLRLSRC